MLLKIPQTDLGIVLLTSRLYGEDHLGGSLTEIHLAIISPGLKKNISLELGCCKIKYSILTPQQGFK